MAPYIAGLESRLVAAGYTEQTRRNMLKVVGDVGRWLAAENLTAADFDESQVGAFGAARAAVDYRQSYFGGFITPTFAILRDERVLPPRPVAAVVAEYRQWMFSEKDLAATTVLRYENLARRFLKLGQPSGSLMDPSTPSVIEISEFILAESRRVNVGSARGRVAEMRYLYLNGKCDWDLAGCVPSVAGWRDAHLPVSLCVEQVEVIVASCDQSTSLGRRDRAMLLLLARWVCARSKSPGWNLTTLTGGLERSPSGAKRAAGIVCPCRSMRSRH